MYDLILAVLTLICLVCILILYLLPYNYQPLHLNKSDYLTTLSWKEKRLDKLIDSKFTCELCGTHSNLEVYHRTDKSIPDEPLSDLITLCKEHKWRTTSNLKY